MDVTMVVIVVDAVGVDVIAGIVLSLCVVVFMVVFGLHLLRAQFGYLHLCKAPFTCVPLPYITLESWHKLS